MPTRLPVLALLFASLILPAPGAAFEPSGLLEIHYINPVVERRDLPSRRRPGWAGSDYFADLVRKNEDESVLFWSGTTLRERSIHDETSFI